MFSKLRIDLSKIRQDWIFEGKNGARYLDLIVKDSKQPMYGNDLMVAQDLPKAVREAGEEKWGPILGNGRDIEKAKREDTAPPQGAKPARGTGYANPPPRQPRQTQAPGSPVIHDDDVPF